MSAIPKFLKNLFSQPVNTGGQVIDKLTGHLLFYNGFTVSQLTTPEELIAYFRRESIKIADFQNGWKHYTICNVKLGETYFLFTFYFEHRILRSIDFIPSDKLIVAGSWNNWSGKEQLRKRDDWNEWLNKEIGDTRKFSWGTIGAYYDMKDGGGSIFLKYK